MVACCQKNPVSFSLVNAGWYHITAVLNFHIFNRPKLHTVYSGISDQIKPLQLVGQAAEFKFESKFEPLQAAAHLAIAPEGCSRGQSKFLAAKSMAKLFGQHSCTAWAGCNC